MSEGSLFNPGFLGASFSWWVGQIADDATWRDNILPEKFESPDQIPGWGYRYKVRIIGLHDQGEIEIPSDQLPWAQVMYPVTAGGGQAKSGWTPNLRQGNMVFGFFLDGQDQQVPVIMGVLGNNAQTQLAKTIGDNRVTNTQPGSLATSGYAVSASGNKDPYIKPPDEGLAIAGKNPTIEDDDAVHLKSVADIKRLELYLIKTVILSPCDFPGSSMKGMQTEMENLANIIDKTLNATQNYADAVSEITSQVGDIISQVGGIVGQVGGIVGQVGGIVGSGSCPAGSAGAAIGVAEKIESSMEKFAPMLAKHMKSVFDKIHEYTSKQIDKMLAPLADTMFPNQRPEFLDMKTEINESIRCLYSKITGGLSEQILSSLKDSLNKCNPSSNNNAPFIPICTVEQLTGNIIAANMNDIDTTIKGVTNSVETFIGNIQSGLDTIGDITSQIGDIAGQIGDIAGQISGIAGQISGIAQGLSGVNIPDIAGNIASALSFENVVLDLFECDSKPNCPASDFYTLQEGGGSGGGGPNLANVTQASSNPSPTSSPASSLGFDIF